MNKNILFEKIEQQYGNIFTIDKEKGILQLKKEFFNELLKKKDMQQAGKLAEHARFIYVPGGEFTMGDDKGEDSENPLTA